MPRSRWCRTALAGGMIALLSGCPEPEKNVLRVNAAAIGELDPHKASDYADSILMFNLYDFLLRPGPSGELHPDLATRWEIEDEGRSYRFFLREDARFHDGSPVTARDVVFSVTRLTTMNRGYAYLLPPLPRNDGIVAEDESTVRFSLDAPFAPFLASLTRVAIVNEARVLEHLRSGDFEAMGDYGSAFLSSRDAGSGSYALVSHNPRELTLMRRVSDHYQPFAPQAPEIVRLKYGLAVPTVRALLSRGEHELTRLPLPKEVLHALAQKPGIELAQDRRATNFFIKLNTRRPPTDDLQVRRAMALAFDYEAMFHLLEVRPGMASGIPTRGPLPPGVLGHDPEAPFPKRDLVAARRTLATAEYRPDEHPVEIQWVSESGTTEQIALLFQQNMAELGIEVEVIRAPWALVLDRAARAETTPHANTVDVSAYTPDPDSLLTAMYHSSSAGSWAAMEWLLDPEIDARIERGRALVDPLEREAHYRTLVRDLVAIQPAIFGYQTATVIAKQDYVHAPRLEEATQAVPTTGANYLFREISLVDPMAVAESPREAREAPR